MSTIRVRFLFVLFVCLFFKENVFLLLWTSQVAQGVKIIPANAKDRRHGLDPWVGKIPRRRK